MKKRRYLISEKSAAIVLTFCITASSIFGFVGGMAAAGYYDGAGSGTSSQLSLSTKADKTSVLTTASTESDSTLTAADVAGLTANSVAEITTETVTTDSWMQQYVTNGAGS
ncbi:MAG TPA: hypothetical protein VM577_01535, partial [Anaerovoracaceae bacterium]|nr:hypothetical protein [Anaerovoracaceae bacterium]